MMKNILLLFIFTFVVNLYSQKAILTNFRIEEENKDRVLFDASADVTGMTTIGFVISEKSISSVVINENGFSGYFKVSSPFTFWDNNTIRLGENDDTSDRQMALHNFTLEYIQNKISEPDAEAYRYVTPNGAGTHDGTSESNAWSVSEIKAKPGMTIGIKIGDYLGKQIILVDNDGLVNKPIKIIGYKKVIGDISSNYYNYGDNLDSSEMPLFDGKGIDNSKGISIKRSDYIIIKNIQVKNFGKYPNDNNYNVCGEFSNNVIIDNVNTEYSNRNVFMTGNNIRVINNNFLNAWEFNHFAEGDNNLFLNNKSYCNKPGKVLPLESTDYYYVCAGNNNTFINNYAKRDGDITHFGHGLTIISYFQTKKRTSKYNLIKDFKSINILSAIELRQDYVSYNVIKGFKSYGEGIGSDKTGGVHFRDGANNNIFERSTINLSANSNTEACIYFQEYDENGVGFGNDNIIRNCIFSNAYIGILIEDYTSGTPTGVNNKILNCTFDNINFFFRENNTKIGIDNTRILNCTFSNIKSKTSRTSNSSFIFDHNNFYNSWTSSLGTNSMNEDPKFKNITGGDFRLRSDSHLIDKGKDLNEVQLDFDGNFRPQGSSTDLGAFEYGDNSSASVPANAGSDQSICSGESVTLTASGGSTYSWSNGATTKSISVNPTSTTTYTVTVSEGGNSDTDDVVVTVNTVDAGAGADQTINEGESVTLTAAGGDSYLWSTGAKTKNIKVTPNKTTIYSVTVYMSNCEDSDSVKVSVNPKIVSDPPPASANAGENVSICSGESVSLSATGGDSYVWSSGDTNKTIDVSPTRTTTYTLYATRGGITDTDTVVVTVENCNATEEEEEVVFQELLLYPNPTTGNLNIQMYSLDNVDLNLVVMSMNGSIVYQDKMESKNNEITKNINLSRLTKGIYLVNVFNENKNFIEKVLFQ